MVRPRQTKKENKTMQDPDLSDYLKQEATSQNQALPFDMGVQAYQDRKMPEANPYCQTDWRNEEWWNGWSFAEDSDPDQMFDHVAHQFLNAPPDKSHPWG